MIPISIAVIIAVVALVVGAVSGALTIALCAAAGYADDKARRSELLVALAGVITNARFGLAQYPDAQNGTRVVEVPLTARECRAILHVVDGVEP